MLSTLWLPSPDHIVFISVAGVAPCVFSLHHFGCLQRILSEYQRWTISSANWYWNNFHLRPWNTVQHCRPNCTPSKLPKGGEEHSFHKNGRVLFEIQSNPHESDHPKCEDLEVAYGRWSLTGIEPHGVSLPWRGPYTSKFSFSYAQSSVVHTAS